MKEHTVLVFRPEINDYFKSIDESRIYLSMEYLTYHILDKESTRLGCNPYQISVIVESEEKSDPIIGWTKCRKVYSRKGDTFKLEGVFCYVEDLDYSYSRNAYWESAYKVENIDLDALKKKLNESYKVKWSK